MSLQPNTEIIVTIEKAGGGRPHARPARRADRLCRRCNSRRTCARARRPRQQAAGVCRTRSTCSTRAATGEPSMRTGHAAARFYAHVSYERQLQLKSDVIADAFARIAKMPLPAPVPVMASQEQGYRMRARLHVKDRQARIFPGGHARTLRRGSRPRQLLPETIDALRTPAACPAAERMSTSCELSENAAATERAILLELAPSETAPLQVDPIDGISGLLFVDDQRGHLTVSYGSPYVTDRVSVSAAAIVVDPSRSNRSFKATATCFRSLSVE